MLPTVKNFSVRSIRLYVLKRGFTRFAMSTNRILVYASRYTLSAFLISSRPLTVTSVSSANPSPIKYSMVVVVPLMIWIFAPVMKWYSELGVQQKIEPWRFSAPRPQLSIWPLLSFSRRHLP